MEKQSKMIEIQTPDGKPLIRLFIKEGEVKVNNTKEGVSSQKPEHQKENHQPRNNANDIPMTEAQKRYLFRILAEQGIEGDQALEHLKKRFQIDSLKEVTKRDASSMIEQLLEALNGGKDDRPPF